MKYRKPFAAGLIVAVFSLGLVFSLSSRTAANENTALLSARASTAASASGFSDVPPGAWYEEAALWCRERGIFTGNTFLPDAVMTRGAAAEALYRVQGSPEAGESAFSDIPAGSRYAKAAAWASANGVMSGYTNGSFGVENPVTREQMATVFWRHAGSPAVSSGEDFSDESDIAGFAQTAADWARANGVVNGKSGNRFDPKGGLPAPRPRWSFTVI